MNHIKLAYRTVMNHLMVAVCLANMSVAVALGQTAVSPTVSSGPDFGLAPISTPSFVSETSQPTSPNTLATVQSPDNTTESWVQPATHLNETSFVQSQDSAPMYDIPSLEELREEIKKMDAGTKDSSLYGKGMTLVLDSEGKKYIRFLSWVQAETTFTSNNPGTVDAYGNLKDSALDISLRRARFLTYSQLTDRYLILLHFGINNQTFTNGGGSGSEGIGGYGAGKKPQLFFHDVWNEYAVIPKSDCRDLSLSVGAGLHYWNGVSRKSNASTLKFMTLDAPVFNWPNIELTDQFGRQLGWYAKGKYRKIDYRVAVNHPFNADNRAALNNERAVNIATHNLAYTGYFEWQLWDQEGNLLPYKTSSYLGSKSVFNLGTGFYIHPDSSGILDGNDQLVKQDQLALGFDAYLDTPVGNHGAAMTLYSVYYVFDYGDNYYRDIGILNTGTLGSPGFLASEGITPAISGAGNRQPFMGTGEILYLEGGYVLPCWIMDPSHGKLQPFAAFTHKSLDWLDDPAFNWDFGLNYLIDGHLAKITFQYSLRPRFIEQTVGSDLERVSDGYSGQFTIQAQVAL
jgi:hypothetical protein